MPGLMLNTLISLFLVVSLSSAMSAEEGWWKNTLGRQIGSFDEFKGLLTKDDVNKVVVGDFYMQNCYWCQ